MSELKRVNEALTTNNSAVVLIQEERYSEALTLLTPALINVQKRVENLNSPQQDSSSNSVLDFMASVEEEDGPKPSQLIEDWMTFFHAPDVGGSIDGPDSYFVYREGITIPLLPTNFNGDTSVHFRAVAYCVIFNHALCYHLASTSTTLPTPSPTDDQGSRKQQLAHAAHKLYTIALSCRVEDRCNGLFLLVACNNLAVVNHELETVASNGDIRNNPPANIGMNASAKRVVMSPHFENLHYLLVSRFTPPSQESTAVALILQKVSENVFRAMGLVNAGFCAGAG
eukprot:scaffold1391_cov123-Cylindrotheca_fusiformis.AAC.2